ncbi:MAG: tetratricopeptide repeat protein [Mangrovimonas sp.]|nr:tetratricopeptide repeat protein [Mangrovimonas sp.]
MRIKKSHKAIFILSLVILPFSMFAQVDFNKTPTDDLGNNEDEFQEYFFEALKQSGIENYDKAVTALQKCVQLDNTKPVIYFELGKNYNQLKNFGAAEDALKKAVDMEPSNEWFLDELCQAYLQQGDTKKAIKTIEQLVEYHPKYSNDLAALYVDAKEYKDALKLLDKLDEEQGYTLERDRLRNEVYAATGQKKKQIKNLEERVADNPEDEENYLKLIYRYSENNDKDMAFETAQKLLEAHPESKLVHLALYKFYLERNETEKALESMKIVVQSPQINPKSKMMVLSDFVKFVDAHPEYEPELVEATSILSDNESPETFNDLGQYYLKKGDKEKALKYFEEGLKRDPNNFMVQKNILLLQIDLKKYEEAKSNAEEALLRYPAQPILYLIHGVSLNELKQAKKAAETLEIGLDYIIDDPKMEQDFYKQLNLAYTLLNNTTKAKAFLEKAKQLESTN